MPSIRFDDPDRTHGLLRDSVEALASRRPGPASVRRKWADASDMDAEMWQAMVEAGWIGLLVPEELGGSGLGLVEQAVLSEALGRQLISEPVAMGGVVGSAFLTSAPQSAERDRLASGIADGSLIMAPAWQHTAADPDRNMMTGKKVQGGYSLSGACHYVEPAQSATDFLILAEMEDGAVLFSVPTGADGMRIQSRAGVDGASIAVLQCEDCFLPGEAKISGAGSVAEMLEQPIRDARVALSAELAGIAAKAVEITIEYTKERVQFGKPIASFQVIQHRLVDMWSDAEFACAAVVNAVETIAMEGDTQASRLAVLAAKARAGDAAVSICRRAVHLHGAMGFTDECDIGLYLKRALSLNVTLGQPEALRLAFMRLECAA